MGIEEIEASAEIAMEHHLGLTCDPVMGLVQIHAIYDEYGADSIDEFYNAREQ